MKKAMLFALSLMVAAPAMAQAPRGAGAGAVTADAAPVGRGMLGPATGEQIFHKVCAACHMHDGKGAAGAGRYPSLAGNANLAVPAYPAMVVVKGLNGMPAIGSMLTDAQVADVVNYVRGHFGNKLKGMIKPEEVRALR